MRRRIRFWDLERSSSDTMRLALGTVLDQPEELAFFAEVIPRQLFNLLCVDDDETILGMPNWPSNTGRVGFLSIILV